VKGKKNSFQNPQLGGNVESGMRGKTSLFLKLEIEEIRSSPHSKEGGYRNRICEGKISFLRKKYLNQIQPPQQGGRCRNRIWGNILKTRSSSHSKEGAAETGSGGITF